jgi:hypothetical protein
MSGSQSNIVARHRELRAANEERQGADGAGTRKTRIKYSAGS